MIPNNNNINFNIDDIFGITNETIFTKYALEIYHMQATKCEVYREYHTALKIDHNTINTLQKIPFLPIEFFKSHKVIHDQQAEEIIFTSSGTTGTINSKHYVSDVSLYEKSFIKGFEKFYGKIEDCCILALLPNYYERTGSSLVYMVDDLIKKSNNKNSGFYLQNLDELNAMILHLEGTQQNTILIGVSFALLDLLQKNKYQLEHVRIMETGGMKGKRKELLKSELQKILCAGFGKDEIDSEYGMTELLSQAYSKASGIYDTVPWMKVLMRDVNDPFTILPIGYTGGINIIDLANYYSCSFIATQDLGRQLGNESFEILGRFDNSDIRGCNLLIE